MTSDNDVGLVTANGGVSLGAVEAECVLLIGAVSGRRCLRRRS